MSKYLIPLNNTPWGVIVNPVTEDTYEHVLSFSDEQTKINFIGKELFNDISFDYTTEIDKFDDTSFNIYENGLTGSISIDIDTLNKVNPNLQYTMTDLMNIDSMFIKEDDKILLYAVSQTSKSTTPNNQTIIFSLSLDVMFNSIDELDLSGQTIIKRAMIDRIKHVDNKYVFDFDNMLNRKYEDIEDKIIPVKETTIKTEGKSNLHTFLDKDGNHSESVKKTVLETSWLLIYVGVKLRNVDADNPSSEPNMTNNPSLGIQDKNTTGVYYSINSYEGEGTFRYVSDDGTGYVDADSTGFYDFVRQYQDAETKVFATSELPPYKMEFKQYEDGAIYIKHFFDLETWNKEYRDEHEPIKLIGLRAKYVQVEDNLMEFEKIITNEFDIYPTNTYKLPYNPDLEIKLLTSHTALSIKTKGGNRSYRLGDIGNNAKFSIIPASNLNDYGLSIRLINDNLVNEENSQNNLMYNIGIDIVQDNELPKAVDKWLEYKANKSVSSYAGFLLNAGKVVGGVALAGATGGLSALGSLEGVSELSSLIFNRQDLKNAPNDIKSIGNLALQKEFQNLDYDITLTSLLPVEKQTVIDYYRKHGNRIDENRYVSDFINSRWAWNFIQTENVFSLIKNRYSSPRKQVINSTFKKGFTIWHIRSDWLSYFKGIGDYSLENLETKLVVDVK